MSRKGKNAFLVGKDENFRKNNIFRDSYLMS